MADDLDIERIFKLKVDGLKQELEKRKLPKSGSKAELQERLLNHLTTGDIDAITSTDNAEQLDDTTEDEELNKEIEESLDKIDTPTALSNDQQKFLGDEPAITLDSKITEEAIPKEETAAVKDVDEKEKVENGETKNDTEAKAKKIVTVGLSESEKIEQRSKRFGAVVSQTEKKKARMDRFGDSKAETNETTPGSDEKLSKRAARFGSTNSANTNTNDGGKLKQRQERFVDEKIKKRQERFGVVQPTFSPTTDLEARKKQRAMKFGIK